MSDHSDYADECADSIAPLPSIFPRAYSTPADDVLTRAVTPPSLRPYKTSPSPLKLKPQQWLMTAKGVVDDAVKAYVRAKFQDKIHREYPVVDYIRTVWNYNPADIPSRSYTLPFDAVNNYCKETEKPSYVHLVKILESLLTQLYPGLITSATSTPDSRTRTVNAHIVNMRDRTVNGNYAKFKPDLGFSTIADIQRQRWDWYVAYAEVKKPSPRATFHTADLPIDVQNLDKRTMPEDQTRATVPQRSTSSRINSSGRKRKDSPCSSEQSHRPSKKSRSNTEKDPVLPPPAQSDKPDQAEGRSLTENEVQSAKYITEMMSHGVRSFASGFLIEDFNMKLWYADRMGLVTSKPFNMFLEPEKLLLVMAALGAVDFQSMGICPFLRFPSTSFDSYDDTKLVFPTKLIDDGDEIEVEFALANSQNINTDYGVVGRGTTIIPIKATPSSAVHFGTEDLVAKVAWPPASRDAEDHLIRVVRHKLCKKKPQYLKHVVDLKCSITRTMEQMRLSRAFMHDLSDYEPRVFRMMVMKKYQPLSQVKSVKEFESIFLDVVRAHYWVWETSSILHRDISANNIMFYRTEDRTLGVLCDWDLAIELSHEDEAPDDDSDEEYRWADEPKTDVSSASKEDKHADDGITTSKEGDQPTEDDPKDPAESRCKARYRTGTGPFMALELLRVGNPPLHHYRFDLESFFFVLAWFVAVFNPETNTLGHVFEWESPDLYTIGHNKKEFFGDWKVFQHIFANTHASYKPLFRKWVSPLYSLFAFNYADATVIHALQSARKVAKENGDLEEQDMLTQDIKERRKTLNERITYASFMARLHVPTDVED